MTYFDNTTVQELDGGDIILIGEEHSGEGARRCSQMAQDITVEVDPATVCVEYPPRNYAYNGVGAMGHLSDYAKREQIPLIHIDKKKDNRRDATNEYGGFVYEANKFTHPIEPDGDLNPQAITDARNRIYDMYGREAYEAMYIEREIFMAGILREIKRRHDTPIIAGMGAFHILAVKDMYESLENKVAFGASRVFDYSRRRSSAPVVHA